MGERTSRRRSINESVPEPSAGPLPPDVAEAVRAVGVEREAEKHAAVQASIDKMAAAADAVPSEMQMDASNTKNALKRSDDADLAAAGTDADAEAKFRNQYETATKRSVGYLQRRRVSGNRSRLVPPSCDVHPKLNMWGLRWGGKWMMIRWISTNPVVRQTRFEQGYQYFEGAVWCERLGLVSSNYLNDRGRVQVGDVELAWVPEEYVFEHNAEAKAMREEMVSTVKDRLMAGTSKHVPNIEIMEGDDAGVMGELRDRRRFAESRS